MTKDYIDIVWVDDTELEYPPVVYWTTTDLAKAAVWARTRKVYTVYAVKTSNHTRYHVKIPVQ